MIHSGVTKFKRFGLLLSVSTASAFFAAASPAAAQTIDSYILIQPIQVCDDSGNNCATLVTFPEATKKIYAQAGVYPILLPANQLNDTDLQSVSGIGEIDGSGGMSGDPLTINAWFVLDLPTGDPNTVLYGEGWIDANGLVVNSTAVSNFNGGNGRTDTFAHEMGHNLNLEHNTLGAGGANNLMTAGSSRSVPGGVGDITPDGLALSVLTQDQIDELNDSPFVQVASDCLGDGNGNVITKTFSEVCLNLHGMGGDDTLTLTGGVVLGDLTGGSGNDTITLGTGSTVLGNVDGGSGNDTITLNGDADPVDVLGGTGNDNITLNAGALVTGSVYGDDNDGFEGDDGSDLIVMNGGTVNGNVDGEGGDDVIRILGGQVDGSVFGGGGNDTIETDEPATVAGDVDGQAGNDTITIASDPADVLGGTGDDVINILSGAVIANVYGDDNDGFEGDDGDDTIVMTGGSVSGDIDAEGGDNLIRIFGGSVGGDVMGGGGTDTFDIAGGTIGGNVEGNNDADTFNLTGGSVGGNVSGGNGDDTFVLTGTSVTGDLSGGNGSDMFTLAGGTVGGEVSGGNNDDTFLLTGTSITGDLSGGNGDDDFTLAGGSVGGDVSGGNNSDSFLLTGTSISGDLRGGNGNDDFMLAGGSVGGDVSGGNNNDTISLVSTVISGDISAGNGSDVIVMTGGSVTDIFGGFNNDVIQVLGGTVNGGVYGDEGDDIIATAEPGTVIGDVDGGADNDTITIASDPADVLGGTGDDTINIVSGAVVTGSVYGDDNDGDEGDDGNDTITLSGGSVAGDILGEGGADTLFVTGGSVTNVYGNGGDDAATWTGGTISNSVGMGAGSDTLDIYGVNTGGTALQAGLSVLDGGDDASSADGEVDTLNLRGVVEVLTDLQNWEFINLLDTSIGDLGQASRTIVTEQFYVESGSALVATGNFGSTQTYVIDGDLWNDGFLDMRDGAPSYDELEATGTYTGGPGSVFRTDTFLGGVGSPSDLMIVGTATAGESALYVYDTNAGPGAYNPVGIPIVDVSAGTTSEDHFFLVNGFTGAAGPIDKGLFFYDLALRPDNVHVLIGVPDLEAFQLGRIPTQMQSAWHTSTGVWHDRTADLRAHLDGTAAPGPAGAVSPGFWIKGVGGFLDRNDDVTFTLFNKSYEFNTSYDQDTYGGLVGGDWAWNGVFAPGDAGVLGVFAGYIGWDAQFDQQSANGGYSVLDAAGPSAGLYTTYLNKGFFVDGVFKADLPEIELNFPGLEPVGPSSDTVDATALGGVLDAGYRHKFGHAWYVEGLGTLSYVDTEIDPALLGGSVIDFGDDQSFRGRLGMGFGGTFMAGEVATVISRLSLSAWHEFDGDNGTDIFSPGGAPLDIRDDFGGTFGEVSMLVNVFGNQTDLSVFVKTDYRFGEDMSEFAGSVGLRYTP